MTSVKASVILIFPQPPPQRSQFSMSLLGMYDVCMRDGWYQRALNPTLNTQSIVASHFQ